MIGRGLFRMMSALALTGLLTQAALAQSPQAPGKSLPTPVAPGKSFPMSAAPTYQSPQAPAKVAPAPQAPGKTAPVTTVISPVNAAQNDVLRDHDSVLRNHSARIDSLRNTVLDSEVKNGKLEAKAADKELLQENSRLPRQDLLENVNQP